MAIVDTTTAGAFASLFPSTYAPCPNLLDCKLNAAVLPQPANSLFRLHVARQTPIDELGDIYPALSRLRLVHPRLWHLELLGQIPLRHARLLAYL